MLRYKAFASLAVIGCATIAGCGAQNAASAPPAATSHASPTATATSAQNATSGELSTSGAAPYIGVLAAGMPGSYAPAASFSAATGAAVKIVGYYSGWTEKFQAQFANTAWKHGAMTMVDMDPNGGENSLNAIANGTYDWYLTQFASAVRAFGHPVIINFGHEMNGTWFSYGYKHVQPATFIQAFRRMHDVFAKVGASNVKWMWTINIELGKRTAPAPLFYPGDKYVDWVGVDGYDWNATRSFQQTFGPTLAQIRSMTSKPILIAETSVLPGPHAAMQVTSWLDGIINDHLLGFIWFDTNKLQAKQTADTHDWRLEDDPAALAAFRAALPAFLGSSR